MISRFPTHKISILQLVSVAEKIGLSLIFSETPKTGFLTSGPYNKKILTVMHLLYILLNTWNLLQKVMECLGRYLHYAVVLH